MELDCSCTSKLIPQYFIINVQLWSVLQVKEGTENRGAIEAVVRVVRKSVSNCIGHVEGRGF